MINYSPWQPIAIALECFFFRGQWESGWGYLVVAAQYGVERNRGPSSDPEVAFASSSLSV